jgi:DNA-directed RNA polymerase subunit beta
MSTHAPTKKERAARGRRSISANSKKPLTEMPNLVEAQIESFKWLIEKGLEEVFSEFSSIQDYSERESSSSTLPDLNWEKPQYDEFYAKDNKLSYEAPLKVTVKLKNKTLGGTKEQEIFMADFPLMTNHGTFIIAGIERVIVPQLARSFSASSSLQDELKGKTLLRRKNHSIPRCVDRD